MALTGAVNNQIRSNRPEQNRVIRQRLAPVTNARPARDILEAIKEFGDPAVRRQYCYLRCNPKSPQDRGGHQSQEHIRSGAGLPALLGFLLQAGASGRRVYRLAPVEGGQAAAELAVETRPLRGARCVMLFQEPERFANNLARQVIAPGLNLGADEFLKLGGKRNVHRFMTSTLLLLLP